MKFTISLSRRLKMRSTHEVKADFQASISLGSMDSVTDSDKRECVLIRETSLESSEGLIKGSSLRGRWSLTRVPSKLDLSLTSYMSLKWSKAAIGTPKAPNFAMPEDTCREQEREGKGCGGRGTKVFSALCRLGLLLWWSEEKWLNKNSNSNTTPVSRGRVDGGSAVSDGVRAEAEQWGVKQSNSRMGYVYGLGGWVLDHLGLPVMCHWNKKKLVPSGTSEKQNLNSF